MTQPFQPSSALLALGACAALSLAVSTFSCDVDSDTEECSSGLRCPPGLVCTLAGDGCTATSCGDGIVDPDEECDDMNAINGDGCNAFCVVEFCGDGLLQPAIGEDCDDGNTAGGDCCSETCQFETTGSSCADGDLCTTGDVCDGAGTCVGAPVVCDDTNVCTDDSCNAGTGVCDFVPNTDPCADGDLCTEPDACSAGVCTSGPLLDCDDGNPCTADACDMIHGCTNTVIIGCRAEVPASGAAGRLLVGLLVLSAGVAAVRLRTSGRRSS